MNALAGMDLNLVVALHALLEERHVTRAAKRVGLSQPAMSHALARLRAHYDDPLLVRDGRMMSATPRATALVEPLRLAVGHLERVLSPDPFDAKRLETTFRIAVDDYIGSTLLPRLVAEVRREAPSVDIELVARARPGRKKMLRRGDVDLAIGYFSAAGMDLRRAQLFEEKWICAVRRGHRLANRRTLKTWLSVPHIVVSPTGGRRGAIDRALEADEHRRRVGLVVPHFRVALDVVAKTDFVVTVPRRLETHAKRQRLATFRPPLALDVFAVFMMWHPRADLDPAQKWLRNLVTDVARKS